MNEYFTKTLDRFVYAPLTYVSNDVKDTFLKKKLW
jgi:hypothetical protein